MRIFPAKKENTTFPCYPTAFPSKRLISWEYTDGPTNSITRKKKINEVLTYMNRRRLWQKDVIQDVFGSQSIFSIFKAVVNRDNKDLPEE